MARLIFMAQRDAIADLDGDPALQFPSMRGLDINLDARLQLYSLATGQFLDEAAGLEEPLYDWCTETITLSQLRPELSDRLASLDETDLNELLEQWAACQDVEELLIPLEDLEDYLQNLVNLCQQARDANAEIFVLSET